MTGIDSTNCHAKFGQYIKTSRMNKHINQQDIADKVGITQSHLSYIERGLRDIDFAMAFKICEALDVDMKDFISDCM